MLCDEQALFDLLHRLPGRAPPLLLMRKRVVLDRVGHTRLPDTFYATKMEVTPLGSWHTVLLFRVLPGRCLSPHTLAHHAFQSSTRYTATSGPYQPLCIWPFFAELRIKRPA